MVKAIHIHTYHRPSGFRVVAEGIYEHLKRLGVPSFIYYGDPVTIPMTWLSGCVTRGDVLVPVWHFGRSIARIVSEAPVDVVMYTFVEGDPIVDTNPREVAQSRVVAIAPNSYVASKISRYFHGVYVSPPPIPERVLEGSPLITKVIRSVCSGYDAVLCYVANDVPRKGWHYLKPVLEALVEEQGIRPCFIAVTNADIETVDSDRIKVIKFSLGATCSDEVIASAISASDVYANLSLNEGFGVPIAMAFLLGKTVASVEAPSIVDSFRDLPLSTCPYKKIDKIEWIGDEVQELFVYDPSDMAKAIARAIDMKGRYTENEIAMKAKRIFRPKLNSIFTV